MQLPEVLRVNLGRASELVSACSLMLPFVRTGMTEEYADNEKVFGRWQPRMLEPFEAAAAVTQLLTRPADDLNLGNFELMVDGTADKAAMTWRQVRLRVDEEELDWSASSPLVYSP